MIVRIINSCQDLVRKFKSRTLELSDSFKVHKAIFLVPILLTQMNCGSKADNGDDSQVDGYFISATNVSKDMRINPAVSIANFATYIKRERPEASWLSPEKLAEKTLIISKCFGVDPYVLTGLMKVESRFIPEAVSPTGAVGLTQFTGIAIDEVHDQTGRRGPGHASSGVIRYFNEVLDHCINDTLTGETDIILWRHTSSRSEMKNKLMENPDLSIIYAAILLKTNLAYQMRSGQSQLTTYDKALRQYNGEPGDRKVRYARNVLAAAGALGMEDKVSGQEDEQSIPDEGSQKGRDQGTIRTSPNQPPLPVGRNDITEDTDPAAYEIYLMYKDGMRDGRSELQSKVLDLQSRLRKLGYKLSIDGRYGDETSVAVAKFQRASRHLVDGFGTSFKDWNTLQQKTN